MPPATTLDFSDVARVLARATRRHGAVAPSFRSPPGIVGADRTIRRRGSGAAVSVRIRGRPLMAVVADMIDGVVATNELRSPEADRLRGVLWEAVTAHLARGTHVAA